MHAGFCSVHIDKNAQVGILALLIHNKFSQLFFFFEKPAVFIAREAKNK